MRAKKIMFVSRFHRDFMVAISILLISVATTPDSAAQSVKWPSVPDLEPKVIIKPATKPVISQVDDRKIEGSLQVPRSVGPQSIIRPAKTHRNHADPFLPPTLNRSSTEDSLLGHAVPPANSYESSLQFVETKIDEITKPWWDSKATRPFTKNNQPITPETLILLALQSSPRLRAISREPMVREFAVDESRAQFDPEAFLDTQFDDKTDPVGNQLTTGGLPFLEDHTWYSEGGFRQKFYTGGDIEVSQRIGFQNNNSRFFDPQDQGTSTLYINFSQPLLRGRGRVYNRSQIVIAELDTDIAWEKYVLDLQLELEAIVNSYWNLYYARSVWLQKQNNVNRGQAILNILEKRRDLDSMPSQIARARAAVLLRRTELANARRDIQNAETEIQRLIGTIHVSDSPHAEIVPSQPPNFLFVRKSPNQIASEALHHRPEVKEAFQRAKVTALQLKVSENELMPELTMLLGTYFSALDGDTGIFRALQTQYTETTPGYYAGFKFNYPLRNRAARSRRNQTAVRLARVRDEIDQVSQTVISESQVALRRLESAYQTLQSSALAISAAEDDLKQQAKRWEAFGLVEGDLADGQNPTVILDQLLDAQHRLANAELTFSRAELEYKSAEIGLRRVTGTLMQQQRIEFGRALEDPTRIEPYQASPPADGNPGNQDFERAPDLPRQRPLNDKVSKQSPTAKQKVAHLNSANQFDPPVMSTEDRYPSSSNQATDQNENGQAPDRRVNAKNDSRFKNIGRRYPRHKNTDPVPDRRK